MRSHLFPARFDGVADEFLWQIDRVLVARPEYLSRHEHLDHPWQLERHACTVYQPTGRSWSFLGKSGVVTVNVHARLSSNDIAMLLDAVLDGEGIGFLSTCFASWIFCGTRSVGRVRAS